MRQRLLNGNIAHAPGCTGPTSANQPYVIDHAGGDVVDRNDSDFLGRTTPPFDAFLIDDVLPDADSCCDLGAQVRGTSEELAVCGTHRVVALHGDRAGSVLDHRVGGVAGEEGVDVSAVVGVDLALDGIASVLGHRCAL